MRLDIAAAGPLKNVLLPPPTLEQTHARRSDNSSITDQDIDLGTGSLRAAGIEVEIAGFMEQ